MPSDRSALRRLLVALGAGLALIGQAGAAAAEPLRVCATVPDLADLARTVGGDAVAVEALIGGADDPHEVHPSPGFVKQLARADLLVLVGADLEVEWLPELVAQAGNPRIADGSPGAFAAATAVALLGVLPPGSAPPRGHVHAKGNPHFLTDPVCGVRVAQALAQRLGDLVPAQAVACRARYRAFATTVAERLLGAAVVARVGADAARAALEQDDLASVVGEARDLGGWLGELRPALGAALIADHDLWPYLARRFHLQVVGWLEPDPEAPPTPRHLTEVIATAKGLGARAIATVPFFDQHLVQLVAAQTALPVVHLAHQVGATAEAGTWMEMVAVNVHALARVLVTQQRGP